MVADEREREREREKEREREREIILRHDLLLNSRDFKSQVCTSQALSESHKLPEQITVRERLVTRGASGVGIHIE